MANPQKGEIILVDRTEVDADGRGSFLKIYDMVGNTYRIAEKRSQLWDIFRNARKAEPVLTIFETYRNVEYIADAKPITDDLLKQAIASQGLKLADQQTEERNRSQALAYAKDMLCAGLFGLTLLFDQAEKNYNFIKGVK